MVPTINHWIGNDHVIKRFRVCLEAAWNDGSRLPHTLLVGPPGCGKTALCHVAAREIGVALHERLAQTITSAGALNSLLLSGEDKDIIFLDEAHELPHHLQTVLYRSMEDHTVFVKGHGEATLPLRLKSICIMLATTDEHALMAPLRDRCKCILPFTHYDLGSLTQITSQRARMMGIPISEHIAEYMEPKSQNAPAHAALGLITISR